VPGFLCHFLITFNFRQKLVGCCWLHAPKFLHQARLEPPSQMLKFHRLRHIRINLSAKVQHVVKEFHHGLLRSLLAFP
jgi:hypothetical protein